jgi:hypothetical protein
MTDAEKAQLRADNFFLKRRCAQLEAELMALNIEIERLADAPGKPSGALSREH